MHWPTIRPLLVLGISAAWFASASPAPAQDSYRLSEDDSWSATEEVEPGSPEGQLLQARRALAAGDYIRAENLATQWIDRYAQHPRLPDAYLLRGDALMAQREYYKAAFDYEFIARGYPGSDAFVTALEREYEIAELFGSGVKRKLWGMRIADASDEAEELYIRIQERLPGSRLAEKAAMALGDFYFRRRQMELAAEMYAIFVENYPDSEELNKARKRLIYAHLAAFKGPEFDSAGLFNARAEIVRLKAYAPTAAEEIGADALVSRIDESNARKLLHSARWYLRTRDLIAAELTIRRLVETYPHTLATADALRLIPQILPQLPRSVLDEAPDYAALSSALLGGEDAAGATSGPESDRQEDRP